MLISKFRLLKNNRIKMAIKIRNRKNLETYACDGEGEIFWFHSDDVVVLSVDEKHPSQIL